MKTNFLSAFTVLAVFATASFLQAATTNHPAYPEYVVSAEQFMFIDGRLEAVVDELVAEALAEPIPDSVLANPLLRERRSFVKVESDQNFDQLIADHS